MAVSPLTTYLVSALLIGSCAGVFYVLLRDRPSYQPKNALEWIGVVLSLLVVFAAVGVSLLTFVGSGGETSAEESGIQGQPAPPLEFRLVDGNEHRTLTDFRGNVVLLNLWATWCPPCLEELPELNRLQEAYGPKGVVVVTISDEQRDTIERFERKTLALNTVSGYLPQDQEWPDPYSRVLENRPTSFVIDREGVIQETWAGAEDFDTFERVVAPHL